VQGDAGRPGKQGGGHVNDNWKNGLLRRIGTRSRCPPPQKKEKGTGYMHTLLDKSKLHRYLRYKFVGMYLQLVEYF
jgi:hypothetical protein